MELFRKSGRFNILGIPLVAVALLAGCSHVKTSPDQKVGLDSTSSVGVASENLPKDHINADGESESEKPMPIVRSDQGDIVIHGVKLKNTHFDYPITINTRVEHWVDYFLGRGRPHFARYLERSEFFIPFIVPLLKQNGMPEDLVYLAMIESGFNNHAASKAKAVGPWQFISATGKRYGLMVNWWVDERRDTRKSTMAAVGYLKDLYGMFQSWELASASYNAGEMKLARAIQRFGTKDFWVLSRQRFLRAETRDYVPKIIAAALIAKNRTQFGFPASTILPGKDEAIAGDGEVVKVEKSEINPLATATLQTIPSSDGETLASILKEAEQTDPTTVFHPAGLNVEPVLLAKPVATPLVSKKGELSGESLVEIEVQSPADLLQIASASGLSYQTVKSLNPEILRWCTPPSSGKYRIKLPMLAKDRFLETYNHTSYPRKVQFLSYLTRSGDSLTRVAQKFGIRVDPMADLNGISPRMVLRKGTRIFLPIPSDRTRTLATLEVLEPVSHRRGRKRRRSVRISQRHRHAAHSRGMLSDS